MKAAIFSFVKVSETSMVASVRIARWLAEHLDLEILDTGDKVRAQAKKGLDLLIIINGAFAFCKHLPELRELVLASARVAWVQNDYTIGPIPKPDSKGQSPFRAAFRERREAGLPDMDFWTTCSDWADKTLASRYVNWNMLTFDPAYDVRTIAKRRKSASGYLLYYGSFRNTDGKKISRLKYFDRYFQNPSVTTKISSPSPKFLERYGDSVTIVEPIRERFYDYLGEHGLGLYIEDTMSHLRFHSPANRFYEMLSAGLPMVFQPESTKMLMHAGFDVEPYVVRDAAAVAGMMDVREDIGRQQRKTWIEGNPHRFHLLLQQQVDEAFRAQQQSLRGRERA